MEFELDKTPHKQFQGVQFGVYSISQIEKLSALEVTNVNTFDALGHPSPGGLYDLKLGAAETDDVCDTCGLNYMHCPGHLGHINLPLPVFNPFFFRTLHKILQGICFECHNLIAPPIIEQVMLYQLKALDHGLVTLAQDLEDKVSQFANDSKESGGRSAIETTLAIKDHLAQIVDKEIIENPNIIEGEGIFVKNVIECRTRIIKNFLRNHYGKGRKCFSCGSQKTTISVHHNTRFIRGKKSKKIVPPKSKSQASKFRNPYEEEIEEMEIDRDNSEVTDALNLTNDDTMKGQTYLTPEEARKHLRKVWNTNKTLLSHIYHIFKDAEKDNESPIDIFFLDAVIVPSNKFRPLCSMRGKKFENPQTQLLNRVLAASITLNKLVRCMKNQDIDQNDKDIISKIPGTSDAEKYHHTWNELQMAVNGVMDSDLDKLTAENKKIPGIKQLLEKKEGLFRKHMMGKRVNYAARSVISPDPYIMVDEIGVPMVFAAKLTYPQPVTPWNVVQLRKAVINGPDVHPGAVLVKNEDGSIIKLNPKHKGQREGIAKQLLTPSQNNKGITGCKKVYRHLLTGDVLLLNRQPTLHKPSIMAHRARVLPGEKTLRLHYANCKTYNADFDGDEMNAHFPQSELARAEAYNIASVRNQFLVPKDGTPLSGLIQDHMIAGVMISMRGSFFNREDYQGLIYGALTFVTGTIKTLPPTIQKPICLWSGKQIFSTIILNIIPDEKAPPSLEGKSKIANKTWQTDKVREWKAGGTPLKADSMSEAEVIIHQGELLCGVLDKAHYGPTAFGLVHCCYEIYGGETSSLLLTSLARLFTHYLQIHSGFTLGIEDILVTPKANKKRSRIMKKARLVGDETVCEALSVTDPDDLEEIRDKFAEAHRSKVDLGLKQLDNSMKKRTDETNNQINKVCFPNGLFKLFPSNNLQLMVQSGAKGSTVNCMQISCLLGQIELEGRRVPLMMSGKTLPSFLAYDTSPRAGGFIDGRFLTGIRPQEFFFHCMAGREGLVDTAVKTSRSGYLQRCLIKHLEGLIVNYDLTVRDSDGSVIQFYYGEDGLDISKRQMLNAKVIPLMVRNHDAFHIDSSMKKMKGKVEMAEVLSRRKKFQKWKRKHGDPFNRERLSPFTFFSQENEHFFKKFQGSGKLADYDDCKMELQKAWWNLDESQKSWYLKKVEKPPDPVFSSLRSDLYFGAVSDKWEEVIKDYSLSNPDNLLESALDDCLNYKGIRTQKKLLPVEDFRNMMYFRTMRSLCDPGEAVGLLAAQSIGEPSTQMTLNTFHFAGRGEMNVTLGIPRLREILMTASANISTPSMDLPLLTDMDDVEQRAEKLRIKLNTVYLGDVLEKIDVTEIIQTSNSKRTRIYKIKFSLLPHKCYKDKYCVKPKKILIFIENFFIKKLLAVVKKKFSDMSQSSLISFRRERKSKNAGNEDDESFQEFNDNVAGDGGESSDEGEGDGDTTSAKFKSRHDQETEYDDPEMEEEELIAQVDDDKELDDDEEPQTKTEIDDDQTEDSFQKPKKQKMGNEETSANEKLLRVNSIVNLNQNMIQKYDFDTKKNMWCQIDLALDMMGSKVDMTSLLENEAKASVVHQVKGITRAFLVKDHKAKGGCGKMLKTEGVNFLEMFKYEDIIDARKVYSNDIHAIAKTYGIEAAAKAVSREVTNVFAAYGIEVDPRHLLLVADYMTFDGVFRACNRMAMESNASPLQQMTFETTLTFLRNATLSSANEELNSPSARMILGKVVKGGTGCFELRSKSSGKTLRVKNSS